MLFQPLIYPLCLCIHTKEWRLINDANQREMLDLRYCSIFKV